jgi:hypothetical protein
VAPRWIHVGVVSIATVVLPGSALIAVADWWVANSHRDCPQGMEFEQSGSKVISERAVPPRAHCRYYYENPDGTEMFPPQDVTYDAMPSIAINLGLAAVCIAVVIRYGRHPHLLRPRPNAPPNSA